MFTINVVTPKPILLDKNAYVSSIKIKMPDLNIKKLYHVTNNHNAKKLSYDDPSHSQR